MESDPEQRRCVIIDGRDWGFETPESSQIIRELNQHVAGYYKELYIAYYLSSDNSSMAKYIIDSNNKEFEDRIFWDFFLILLKLFSG